MHYFANPGIGERSSPIPGDYIWKVPIRYWEVDKWMPVKIQIISIQEQPDGTIGVFGIPEGEDQSQWYRLSPFQWFTNYESARRVQFFLAEISGIIDIDDADLAIKKSGILDGLKET